MESRQAEQAHKENEQMNAQPPLQEHSETESNGEQSQPESHSEMSKEENMEGHVADGPPETNYHGQHHSRPTYGIKQPVSHSIRQPPAEHRDSQSSQNEEESDHSSQMSDEYEEGHNEPLNAQKNDGDNEEMESDFEQPSEHERPDEAKEHYGQQEEDEDKLSDSAYKNHAKRLNEQRNYWPSSSLHQKKLEDSYNQQNKMMYYHEENHPQTMEHEESQSEMSESPEPKQAHQFFNPPQHQSQTAGLNMSNIHSSQNTFLQTGEGNNVPRMEKEPHHLLIENEPSQQAHILAQQPLASLNTSKHNTDQKNLIQSVSPTKIL